VERRDFRKKEAKNGFRMKKKYHHIYKTDKKTKNQKERGSSFVFFLNLSFSLYNAFF